MESVSVLVAEHGADWGQWARKLRATADSLIVLVQAEREEAGEFAERVTPG